MNLFIIFEHKIYLIGRHVKEMDNIVRISNEEIARAQSKIQYLTTNSDFKALFLLKKQAILPKNQIPQFRTMLKEVEEWYHILEQWTEIRTYRLTFLTTPTSVVVHPDKYELNHQIEIMNHRIILDLIASIIEKQYMLTKRFPDEAASFSDIIFNGNAIRNPTYRPGYRGKPLYFRFTETQWDILTILDSEIYRGLPLGFEIDYFLKQVLDDVNA